MKKNIIKLISIFRSDIKIARSLITKSFYSLWSSKGIYDSNDIEKIIYLDFI